MKRSINCVLVLLLVLFTMSSLHYEELERWLQLASKRLSGSEVSNSDATCDLIFSWHMENSVATAHAEEPMQLASSNAYVLGAGVTSASVATDSCTGGLLFSWHLENADVTLGGIAGGVNNGCVVDGGDTTATTASAAVLDTVVYKTGIKSGQFPTTLDNFNFTVSSNNLIKSSAGTIDLWVYVDTFGSASGFISAQTDTSNVLWAAQQTISTYNQFRFTHKANTTERTATTTFATGFSEDTWYHVIIKWDETVHGTAYAEICADETDGTTNCGSGTGEISGWVGDIATLYIGEQRGNASVTNVDDVKIYDTWK